MKSSLNRSFGLIAAAAIVGGLATSNAGAQALPANGVANATATPFVPIENEPPAKLAVGAPLAGPLARGVAVIPYRTENFRILPVFGPSAVDVSPRAGHLHVSVDNLPWHWADAGANATVVVADLPAGPHSVLIELAMPDHQVIAGQAVSFIVPVTQHATNHR